MKTSKIKMAVIFLLVLVPYLTFAQEETEVPEAPEFPEFDLNFEHFRSINLNEEKELLKNLKADLQKQLQIIKKNNKEKYFHFLEQSQFSNFHMPFLVKREQKMHEREKKIFEAEIKIEALAINYESVNQNEKEKVKIQLREELNNLFVQKEKSRSNNVEELRRELVELQKRLAARQKNKKQIIERRLQELLNEEEYLDWD